MPPFLLEKNMAIDTDYWVECSIEDVGLDADHLYKQLMGDQCFCITDVCPPDIDLNGDEWKLAIDLNGPLYKNVERIEIGELTNDSQTGAFDQVIKSIREILGNELDRGRITSAQYATSLTALIESSLANSTQFLLQKDNSFWQAMQGQYDAMAKRAQVELVKAQIALAQMQQINQQVEFTNGKMNLMVQKENYCTALANREITVAKQAELSDSQIALYKQQIVSYQRDSEVKAARLFTDAWITMKTIDEGLTAPNGFTNARVDDVLLKIRTENGFVITP